MSVHIEGRNTVYEFVEETFNMILESISTDVPENHNEVRVREGITYVLNTREETPERYEELKRLVMFGLLDGLCFDYFDSDEIDIIENALIHGTTFYRIVNRYLEYTVSTILAGFNRMGDLLHGTPQEFLRLRFGLIMSTQVIPHLGEHRGDLDLVFRNHVLEWNRACNTWFETILLGTSVIYRTAQGVEQVDDSDEEEEEDDSYNEAEAEYEEMINNVTDAGNIRFNPSAYRLVKLLLDEVLETETSTLRFDERGDILDLRFAVKFMEGLDHYIGYEDYDKIQRFIYLNFYSTLFTDRLRRQIAQSPNEYILNDEYSFQNYMIQETTRWNRQTLINGMEQTLINTIRGIIASFSVGELYTIFNMITPSRHVQEHNLPQIREGINSLFTNRNEWDNINWLHFHRVEQTEVDFINSTLHIPRIEQPQEPDEDEDTQESGNTTECTICMYTRNNIKFNLTLCCQKILCLKCKQRSNTCPYCRSGTF